MTKKKKKGETKESDDKHESSVMKHTEIINVFVCQYKKKIDFISIFN